MHHSALAITLILITILYVAVMILLFWRYRVSMHHLSEKMRECGQSNKSRRRHRKKIPTLSSHCNPLLPVFSCPDCQLQTMRADTQAQT